MDLCLIKFLHLFVPQFPDLQNGDSNSIFLYGCDEEQIRTSIQGKHLMNSVWHVHAQSLSLSLLTVSN